MGMCDSALVTIKYDEFEILKREAESYKILKNKLAECCEIDRSEYEKTNAPEDLCINVKVGKVSDIIKEYGNFESNPNGVRVSKEELLYANACCK